MQFRLAASLVLLAFAATDVVAQAPAKKKLPPPQVVTVTTKDGVDLRMVYYPGLHGKESVPVVLLHSFKGSGKDYQRLAERLQSAGGHAVFVPDLRGHGRSTKGLRGDLDAERFRAADFGAMVAMDLEAIKKFILERNNAGELNVEKLCLVGAEMGAVVAVNWSASDWNWPILPTVKQGRDVKALVLISPEWSFKGLRANEAILHPAVSEAISILLVVGAENSRALRDAKRMYTTFEKARGSTLSGQAGKKDLFFMDNLKTSLQGTQLLGEPSLRVDDAILQFIDLRLVQQSYPWTDRSR